ncbi:hypothetical protein ACVI1L_006793 [Bradyrhizobium sp. USDA 4516]
MVMKASEIEAAVRSLVSAQETSLGYEVTVPVAYGDGELTSVVIEAVGDHLLAHDAGFAAMRLTNAGVSLSRHVSQRLNEFCHRYRCVFSNGRVSATADSQEALPQVICLVANASRSVADYVYELRRQNEYDFRTVVFERAREIVGARLRPTEEFLGKSGRRYRLPVILDQTQSRPEHFLATLAHRQVVTQHFAMFYDLMSPFPDVKREAVYDENADIREEDRALIASVGADVFTLMEAPLRFRAIAGHA